jgi:hypothetical protein
LELADANAYLLMPLFPGLERASTYFTNQTHAELVKSLNEHSQALSLWERVG